MRSILISLFLFWLAGEVVSVPISGSLTHDDTRDKLPRLASELGLRLISRCREGRVCAAMWPKISGEQDPE